MRALRNGTLLLAASALVAGGARGAQAPSHCVLLEVAGQKVENKVQGPPHFSATTVVDLTLRLHMSADLTGDHLVQFRAYTPTKSLYQAIDVPIVDPATGVASKRVLAGYPFPVKEQKPRSAVVSGSAVWSTEAPFPVGGTTIVSSGLYGTWTVQAMLDDGAKPLCEATFAIDP